MLPRTHGIPLSPIPRAAWLATILLLFVPANLAADQRHSNVVCREELSQAHREELTAKLRKITGFSDLKFDSQGILRQGDGGPVGGSRSARELIVNAIHGSNVVIIEDASHRGDVAFARVIPGKWKTITANAPPTFVVQLDFADFDQLVGDESALEAFNVGWAILHELDHVVNDNADAHSLGETGECEAHINQMRRECHLPERSDYYSTLFPLTSDSTFTTRLVRLAFEQQESPTDKKKRYWVVWDANVVGGLEGDQIANLR